jgi:murein DD-endopeptidase MepM/ murein hydrolase activator NlpD
MLWSIFTPERSIIDPGIPVMAVIIVGLAMASFFSQVVDVAASVEADPIPNEPDFIMPYDNYVVTQGLHGFSYGHMALDLSAGKGEVIKSPINGEVSAYYVDGLGNPTLVIENEIYRITFLHGKYTVPVGEALIQGQKIGTESNLGNTTDMQGRSCANRDCGYHTHLNVYNKVKGKNINPFDLINP